MAPSPSGPCRTVYGSSRGWPRIYPPRSQGGPAMWHIQRVRASQTLCVHHVRSLVGSMTVSTSFIEAKLEALLSRSSSSAATHVALKQELKAAQFELKRMAYHVDSLWVDKDVKMRDL
ncbi:hypothetical protein ACFX14_007887 [Malus domestica]